MSDTFTMPIWTCPACNKEQQYDEYYFLETDSTMLCQHCEAEFTVLYTDCIMNVTIGHKP